MNRKRLAILSFVIFLLLVVGAVNEREPAIFLWGLIALVSVLVVLWANPREGGYRLYVYNWRGALVHIGGTLLAAALANALLLWIRGYMNWGLTFIYLGGWIAIYAFGFVLHRLKRE